LKIDPNKVDTLMTYLNLERLSVDNESVIYSPYYGILQYLVNNIINKHYHYSIYIAEKLWLWSSVFYRCGSSDSTCSSSNKIILYASFSIGEVLM
jgi:hypothetical protein